MADSRGLNWPLPEDDGDDAHADDMTLASLSWQHHVRSHSAPQCAPTTLAERRRATGADVQKLPTLSATPPPPLTTEPLLTTEPPPSPPPHLPLPPVPQTQRRSRPVSAGVPPVPVRSSRRPPPPPTTPILLDDSWRAAIETVKELYVRREYAQCRDKCVEMLGQSPSEAQAPVYTIYFSFYAATARELMAQALHAGARYKLPWLEEAQHYFQQAEAAIVAAQHEQSQHKRITFNFPVAAARHEVPDRPASPTSVYSTSSSRSSTESIFTAGGSKRRNSACVSVSSRSSVYSSSPTEPALKPAPLRASAWPPKPLLEPEAGSSKLRWSLDLPRADADAVSSAHLATLLLRVRYHRGLVSRVIQHTLQSRSHLRRRRGNLPDLFDRVMDTAPELLPAPTPATRTPVPASTPEPTAATAPEEAKREQQAPQIILEAAPEPAAEPESAPATVPQHSPSSPISRRRSMQHIAHQAMPSPSPSPLERHKGPMASMYRRIKNLSLDKDLPPLPPCAPEQPTPARPSDKYEAHRAAPQPTTRPPSQLRGIRCASTPHLASLDLSPAWLADADDDAAALEHSVADTTADTTAPDDSASSAAPQKDLPPWPALPPTASRSAPAQAGHGRRAKSINSINSFTAGLTRLGSRRLRPRSRLGDAMVEGA